MTPDGSNGDVARSAVLSSDARYRYELRREWDPTRPLMCWVMLNPSVADARVDDPTTRRCMSLARREHMGGIVTINLYALRCTDPGALRLHDDPEGPDNASTWERVLLGERVSRIVCAWGAFSDARVAPSGALARSRQHLQHAEVLGWTTGGAPRHPLYVSSSARLGSFAGGFAGGVPRPRVAAPC